IQYTSIIKLFLLPKLDEIHTMFVIGLDPPIRQGQTRYPFLVMQFVKDEETDVVLNIDEEVLNTQYDGKLEPKYEAPTYEVVSTLFKVLSQRKVTVPNKYRSHHSVSAVKCSMKANEGYLYPLEKCFLFIPKPTTFIPNVDIDNVIFSRVSGNLSTSRTFDLRFNMKSGVDYQFSSINREEYNNLESFIQSKGIKTSNEMNDDGAISYDQLDAELGEDDDDNEVLPPRRNRGGDFKDDMDIDEDSVDEDFQDGDTDSDVEEEFDENYAGGATSSEDD
ncbi:3808_t:CDS:2, partial [Paraglomus brasilianum]